MHYKRTHNCHSLTKKNIGETISLCGWVHRRRDHGGLIFIDLRDRFGLTQIVFRPSDHGLHAEAGSLRSEWVITITGEVVARSPGMNNPKLQTGDIEINVQSLGILSKAHTPPFSICEEHISINDELRFRYRYLDIRRGDIARRLTTRHQIVLTMRNYLDRHGFLEITTPILAKSTPEGARDYLVPSRLYPGSFFALPQSPQLFKQLLMIGGMDRYFQIATCFRDEDSRSDRQPEFAQLDMELSFSSQQELFTLLEGLFVEIFRTVLQIEISTPFPSISHAEAIENYGCDKPDMRFGMPLIRVDEIIQQSDFLVFKEAVAQGGVVKGICVKGGAALSRKEIEDYTAFVSRLGARGLAWIKIQPEGPTSNITKFFSPALLTELVSTMGGETQDLLFFIADAPPVVNQCLDHLRRRIGKDRGLIPSTYAFTWVTEFPLLEWDAEKQTYSSAHHPFTSPHPDDIPLLTTDPLQVRSSSYDLVLNGYELGSGSERIFDSDLQTKIFSCLQLTPEETKKRFGFFIEALQYGTPPHMGIALGIDRITMLLTGAESIREVIAFPKTQKAVDLMLDAPSTVRQEQLKELKIHVELPE